MKKVFLILMMHAAGCFAGPKLRTASFISDYIPVKELINNVTRYYTNARIDLSRYSDKILTVKTNSLTAEYRYSDDKIFCNYIHECCNIQKLHSMMLSVE